MKKFSYAFLSIIVFCLVVSCTIDEGGSSSDLFDWCGSKSYISPNNVTSTQAKNQGNYTGEWWNETEFYHIWVKSFADGGNDGMGDFKGIEESLDYIQDVLGCSGIWLSPIFDCDYKGDNMHGYDVKDYYAVNPYFGTIEDLESLINACHKREMKIIFDYVPNHSGTGNQWFIDSCNDKNDKKDWYMWNERQLNWNPMGGDNTWHKNPNGNDWYYAAFWEGQPDLNFRNYEVREEMKNVVRYWLNKGFDGLRIDAVRYLIENKNKYSDTEQTHKWFAELREELEKYSSSKFMVCEAWIENDRKELEKYFGTERNKEFHMVLDFDQGRGIVNSVKSRENRLSQSLFINRNDSGLSKYYGTFLTNHDLYQDRLGTLFDNNDDRKLATAFSLLRPTVPFIYYGNEIGQKNAAVSGDLCMRYPFRWDTVQLQISKEDSLLNYNRTLLSLRKNYSSLFAGGKVDFVPSPSNYAVYTISEGDKKLLIISKLDNQANILNLNLDCTSLTMVFGKNGSYTRENNLFVFDSIASKETLVFEVQ